MVDEKPKEAAAGVLTSADASAVEPATEQAPKADSSPAVPTPLKTKRASFFGQFVDRVRSPGLEKKESDVVPAVATSPEEPKEAATDAILPIAGSDAEPKTEALATNAVVKEKESDSVLSKFLSRDRFKSFGLESPSVTKTADEAKAGERSKGVLASTTAAATTSTSPLALSEAKDALAVEGSAMITSATGTPELAKDKRRTSFFANIGGSGKKERKVSGGVSDSEKSADARSNLLGNLFRKPSQALRGKDLKTSKDSSPAVPAKDESKAVASESSAVDAAAATTHEPSKAVVPPASDPVPDHLGPVVIESSLPRLDTAPAVASTA